MSNCELFLRFESTNNQTLQVNDTVDQSDIASNTRAPDCQTLEWIPGVLQERGIVSVSVGVVDIGLIAVSKAELYNH